MFDRLKSRLRSMADGESKDKRMVVAIIILVVFVLGSLVMSLRGGSVHELRQGFRFQVSDGIVLLVLGVIYVIYLIRGGRKDG